MRGPPIRVRELHVRYRRRAGRSRAALEGCSLDVPAGGITAVIGANASGKSTLLRVLLGTRAPTRGTALIEGRTPLQYRRLRGVGYLPERLEGLAGWTAPGLLGLGAHLAGLGRGEAQLAVDRAASRLGAPLGDDLGTLSKGMMRRVALAYTLLGDPPLLLLDEPEAALDSEGLRLLHAVLREERERGVTTVMASHDVEGVRVLADHVVTLDAARPHPGAPRSRAELG